MEWILIILALVWILVAIIQDFKSREVANWLNFSLIIFAIAVRLFYSIFSNNYNYILFGLFGLAVFFVVAHMFYYARLFAGGDAKLLIALGAVIPFADTLYTNVLIFLVFIIALFFSGAIYSLIYSFILTLINVKKFTKEFTKRFKSNKKYFYGSLIFAILFLISSFFFGILMLIAAGLIFIFPYLYVYVKSVEQACLVKEVSVKELTVGDWLVKNIKVKGKLIKPGWEGLDEKDLKFIQKNYKQKVLVKYGVPFTPAFLFGFLFIVYVYLRHPNWSFLNLF